MKHRARVLLIALPALCSSSTLFGESEGTSLPRHITLQEAVQLALKHNHNFRLSEYKVQEKRHAKESPRAPFFLSYETTAVLYILPTRS